MSFFAARFKRGHFFPLEIPIPLVRKEKLVSLFVYLALLSSLLTSQRGISEPKKNVLDIQMKGDLSRHSWGLRPLVWGHLKPTEIVINGQVFKLNTEIFQDEIRGHPKASTPEIKTPVERGDPQPPNDKESSANSRARLSGPLVWTSIWTKSQLARCHREPKVRDLLFLASTMVTDIERIEIEAHPDLVECSTKIRSELALLNFVDDKERSIQEKILKISIYFKKPSDSQLLVSEQEKTESQALKNDQVEKNSTDSDKITVKYNGRELTLHTANFFATDVDPRRSASIEVFLGSKLIGSYPFQPLFLRNLEPTPVGLPDIHFVMLTEDSSKESVRLRSVSESDPFWKRLHLSIPIYVELGIGYTLLDPVPAEGVRDRPTLSGHITTQPIYHDWFLGFSSVVSLKSGSRIPWALLGQAHLKKMIDIYKGRLQITVGFGIRIFKSKIDRKEHLTDDSIVVPESVISPDTSLGMRFKWARTYSQILIGVAPLKVGNSPILYDFNTSLAFGYRWTEATSVIITTSHQRVSFPTNRAPVHLGLSSLLLGIQHDME